MFFKKIKKTSILLLVSLFIFPISTYAYSDEIYASGENIGIKISSNGILVVGSYLVNGIDNCKESGLQKGDIILEVNGVKTLSIDEMVNVISSSNKEYVSITYKRDEEEKKTNLHVVKDESNVYKTGLYVKDSITGIGTLTFIDPNTKLFGALGHEVADSTTGVMLEVKDGTIFSSSVTSIDRSSIGEPGSKNAKLNTEDTKGVIHENTEKGIFGLYESKIKSSNLYTVASIDDIKKGDATILTVTEDNTVKSYKIEILKIDKDESNLKNILFEIKDKELLEKTGGVVQGMSGSPIIQEKFIIGAVTHVVVNHPSRGYGIFIKTMLEEAENERD